MDIFPFMTLSVLYKLDLAVDKDASDMCGRVGLGTSNITGGQAIWMLSSIRKRYR